MIGEVDQSLYVEKCEPLVCSDIIFALLNDAFNRTEPIVYGFTIEARKFNTDIDKRKENERVEVIGRACIAKEMTIELLQEIQNKVELLEQMETQAYSSGVNFYESASKVRFLMCRLKVQSNNLTKSAQVIDLALEKFGQHIDNDIQSYNSDLNNIMKVFTFISVSFLPQTVMGSLFGMNVPVPFMTSEENTSIVPWLTVVGISIFFTLLAFGYFRHVKYI